MASSLNTELLASMLKNKREKRGLRELAKEIGEVSFSTLSRIEQGNIPDIDTYIRICKWLDVTTETFILEGGKTMNTASTKDMVVAQLRAEKTLSKSTIDTLVSVIDMAYKME
jgi:transcriptional regulator with XRE-family HTH domain